MTRLITLTLVLTLICLMLSGLALAAAPLLPNDGTLAYLLPSGIGFGTTRFTLVLFDNARGQHVRLFSYENGYPTPIQWSYDGSHFLTESNFDEGGIYTRLFNLRGVQIAQLDPDQTLAFPGAYNARWSPDGRRIVFLHGRYDSADLYSADLDGTDLRPLTDHPAADRNFTFSPDGRQIAFESNREGGFNLYVMDADGADLRNLTQSPYYVAFPSWSPDGRYIAYQFIQRDDDLIQVGVFDLLTGEKREFPRRWRYLSGTFVWSPDSTRVAFTADVGRIGIKALPDLFVLEVASGQFRRLTSGDHYHASPTWSPDSTRLAFTYREGRGSNRNGIHLVNADGSGRIGWIPGGLMPLWRP